MDDKLFYIQIGLLHKVEKKKWQNFLGLSKHNKKLEDKMNKLLLLIVCCSK